jgi:hypothetical protein
VRAYHGELQKLELKPYRELKADLELTTTATSYAGTGATVSLTPSTTKTLEGAKPQSGGAKPKGDVFRQRAEVCRRGKERDPAPSTAGADGFPTEI